MYFWSRTTCALLGRCHVARSQLALLRLNERCHRGRSAMDQLERRGRSGGRPVYKCPSLPVHQARQYTLTTRHQPHSDLGSTRNPPINVTFTTAVHSSMIVREIVERDPSSAAPAPPKPPAPSSHKHGFPAPRRRTAQAGPSRFAQSSQRLGPVTAGPSEPNPSLTTRDGEQFPHLDFAQPFHDRLSQSDELRRQMDEENNARVQSMTEEEREQEREELLARFGGGLVGLMRKRKEQREREKTQVTARGQWDFVTTRNKLMDRS